MNFEENRSEELNEDLTLDTEPDIEPEESDEEEVPVLDPPVFSANTLLNAATQKEASEAVTSKKTKITSYVCFALIIAALGLLIWQYFATKDTSNLFMIGLVVLAMVYLIYSHFTMPKKALIRWEDSIYRSYGSRELHLCTEFYRLSLAQTVQEDGSVNVQGYSDLSDFRESEHLFLLRRSKQQWFFIAKDGFTVGTPEEFRTFITERLEGK